MAKTLTRSEILERFAQKGTTVTDMTLVRHIKKLGIAPAGTRPQPGTGRGRPAPTYLLVDVATLEKSVKSSKSGPKAKASAVPAKSVKVAKAPAKASTKVTTKASTKASTKAAAPAKKPAKAKKTAAPAASATTEQTATA